MGVWHDIKARLGFGEDEYEDYEEYDEADGEPDSEPRGQYRGLYDEAPLNIRRVTREPDLDRARDMGQQGAVVPVHGVQAVPQVKMQIVEPRAYAEAQAIADKFKVGVPVIMNLTMTDPDLAKRLIDFASGLTYGLNGGLQKVSEKMFMLTPDNMDVSDDQRAVLRDRGLFGDES